MKIGLRFFSLIVPLFLAACATPLTTQQLSEIKTIGIINNFPQYPNFLNVGTTVFNNQTDAVREPEFREYLVSVVDDYLREKGYTPEFISDKASGGNADMLIELIPRDSYGMVGSYGFGFYQKSLLGKIIYKNSYVSLNVSPIIAGRSKCIACYAASRTDLPIEKMPPKWADLDDDQKEKFRSILKADIKKALVEVLKNSGL